MMAMGELTPEQVAEIRREAQKGHAWLNVDAVLKAVLALCDTVDVLREQLDKTVNEPADRATRRDCYQVGLAEGRNQASGELQVLRGVARRLRDGWFISDANPHGTSGWVRMDGSCADGWQTRDEPMTEAEMAAIYGPEGDAG